MLRTIYIYILYIMSFDTLEVSMSCTGFLVPTKAFVPSQPLQKKTHGVSLTNATSASERLPTTGVALKTRPANCYCYC